MNVYVSSFCYLEITDSTSFGGKDKTHLEELAAHGIRNICQEGREEFAEVEHMSYIKVIYYTYKCKQLTTI